MLTGGPIAVLGAGAWGTAFACALAGRMETRLWARDADQARTMAASRRNDRYLPGIELPLSLVVTAELAHAASSSLLVLATPVAALSGLLADLSACAPGGVLAPVVWLSKGFERGSGRLAHEIFAASAGAAVSHGVLSGPSFAIEVARGLPCALTLAARDEAFAREAAVLLHGGRMRIYHSTDLAGVEIAGAVKNVLAIAVGISDGLGLGQNARAALITRGLAEMTRLGVASGGRPQTFMGLAGAGDLILTTTGDLSRNRRVGLELARGQPLAAILAALGHVAEGVNSAAPVAQRARELDIEMPVTEAVCRVLDGSIAPARAAEELLAREPKMEY